MPYIANTEEQQRQMLADIGVKDIDALFADIPPALRCGDLNLPSGLTEQETVKKVAALASYNTANHTSFLGGGFYDHYIPAAVPALVMRSEFYTAYTPYQPEVSQGTLQAIYEFQSAICRLTEMEVSNASLYDGGTAVFEAILMSMRITGRNRIIIDDSLSPIYRKMAESYTTNLGIELIETESKDGTPCRETIEQALNDQTAALFVQNPNFFGCIDDVGDLADMAHKNGALLVVSAYPISLGLLKTPGAMGADIVIGEGQSLGMPLSFGGPYLGFMACRKKHMRKMPGRISGRTVDDQDRQGFVLTLQAREQHIRREKATSNICTNQGLCALTSLVYMSLLGKTGLHELAEVCAAKTEYSVRRLTAVPGVSLRFPENDHFNEFVLNLPIPAEKVIRELFSRGIAAGFPLRRYWPEMDNCLLVAVTEKRTKEDIDYLAHALEVIL